MAQRKATDEDTRTQRQKFIDTAREHGASEDAEAFRRALRKVATAPVAKPKKGAKRPNT
jgi:hypothetical protein